MKEKVIFTTALCLSAMTQMMAQNITGKVMDMKGEPLAFANVVLLNRTDSAFVKSGEWRGWQLCHRHFLQRRNHQGDICRLQDRLQGLRGRECGHYQDGRRQQDAR